MLLAKTGIAAQSRSCPPLPSMERNATGEEMQHPAPWDLVYSVKETSPCTPRACAGSCSARS